MLGTQAVTAGMSKILNMNNKEEDKDKYLNLISPPPSHDTVAGGGGVGKNTDSKDIQSILSEFPLNLLTDIDQLFSVELIFLSVLFNLYLGDLLSKVNYTRFLPNNSFGGYIQKFLNRYINVWSKSQRLLLIISWICLVICVIFSKFFLYTILNY